MGSRWSKVIKEDAADVVIENYDMLDLEAERFAKEAAEKAVEPPHDCSLLQQEAYESGRRIGQEEGRAEVRNQAEAQSRRALELVHQVEQVRLQGARQAEQDIGELAMAIAKKVILRETTIDQDIVVNQARAIIGRMDEKGLIRILVHPSEVDELQAVRSSFSASDGKPVRVHIDGDPSIQPGGCRLESSQYFIDATVETQLQEIWEGLMASHADSESLASSESSSSNQI